MLLPTFTYCSIITSTCTETFERKILSFENRADRIIYQNCQHIKGPSIRSIQKHRIAMQVYDCIHGYVCENLGSYFDVMSNKTRNKNKLIRLPLIRLESAKNSFRFAGANEYNNLPIEVSSATSRNEFKFQLDKIFNL